MSLHPYRVRFPKGIVADVLPPRRRSRKVVVLCDGLPSSPCKGNVLDFLSRKNFWAVHVRYRGAWESGGEFLAHSPAEDVAIALRQLPRGFENVWDGRRDAVDPTRAFVIGASFGGTTAIMASMDPRVTKAVALAPVVDWRREGEGGSESPEYLRDVIRRGYGGAYRFAPGAWRKLLGGSFFDPWSAMDRIDGGKLLIVHARDDEVTSHDLSSEFAGKVGCGFISRARGGHLSASAIMRPMNWKRIARFLNT